ncbi:hypothetical protein [Rhizobium rhizogenes]|nr:hypothetical protein [Rhizobium rhizogenes]
MFLLRVDLTGPQPFQIFVLLQCLELFLQHRRRFHRCEDRGNPAVDFQ